MTSRCWKTSSFFHAASTEEQRKRILSEYRDDDTSMTTQALTKSNYGLDNILTCNVAIDIEG